MKSSMVGTDEGSTSSMLNGKRPRAVAESGFSNTCSSLAHSSIPIHN